MTPPPNMSRRNTANFQPWSLCGISFLAAGNLATSAVETPKRDALTRIVLRRLDAFSQAIFVGLLFEADLDFTCTWSILAFQAFKLNKLYMPDSFERGISKALQLLAICPRSEQYANEHRTDIGTRKWTLSDYNIHLKAYERFIKLAGATIHRSIQISRGPFCDWIPSCRARRVSVSLEFAGPALRFTALRILSLTLRALV